MKRRKGQYVRARRRRARSRARKRRVKKTAILLESGFDVKEIASFLGMSKSTIYDYRREIKDNNYPTSKAVSQIEYLQSNLAESDIDKKNAAKVYFKVFRNFHSEFENIEEFVDSLKYKLNLEELDYEMVSLSFNKLNRLVGSFVSQRNRYLRQVKIHRYGGIGIRILGVFFILSGFWHLIINLDPFGIMNIFLGVLIYHGGKKFTPYSGNEDIAEFLGLDDVEIEESK